MVKQISTSEEYEDAVSTEGVVVVDFFAEWCGPCRFIAPEIEKYESELSKEDSADKDKVIFLKIDVDQLFDLAQKLQISAMPTFLVYNKGELIKTIVGADLTKIKTTVKECLEKDGGKDQTGEETTPEVVQEVKSVPPPAAETEGSAAPPTETK